MCLGETLFCRFFNSETNSNNFLRTGYSKIFNTMSGTSTLKFQLITSTVGMDEMDGVIMISVTQ